MTESFHLKERTVRKYLKSNFKGTLLLFPRPIKLRVKGKQFSLKHRFLNIRCKDENIHTSHIRVIKVMKLLLKMIIYKISVLEILKGKQSSVLEIECKTLLICIRVNQMTFHVRVFFVLYERNGYREIKGLTKAYKEC